jgi:quercetin dioxygenase-like cupin family protein
MKRGLPLTMLVVCLIATAPLLRAGEVMAHPMSRNIADAQFTTLPGMPTCATAAVVHGDPSKGGSIILAKLAAGCTFPWHWHTPTENLMLVSGTAHLQAKDGAEMTLEAGGFASMPSKHIHKFHCASACTLYVQSDAAFDMHYVNAAGKELSPDEALRAVDETAAK